MTNGYGKQQQQQSVKEYQAHIPFSVDLGQERGHCVVAGTAETSRNGPAAADLDLHQGRYYRRDKAQRTRSPNGRLNGPGRPYATASTPLSPSDRHPAKGPPLSQLRSQSHTQQSTKLI